MALAWVVLASPHAAHAGALTTTLAPPAPAITFTDRVGVRLTPPAAAAWQGYPSRVLPAASTPLAGVAAAAGVVTFEREFPPVPARAQDPRRAGAAATLDAFYVAHLAPGADPVRALQALRGAAGVADAWTVTALPVTADPNDSLWLQAWHLKQPSRRDVHALEAWQTTRGDSIVVAILDTGILPFHPDLGSLLGPTHLWINPAERDGVRGADDDGNGYVDDSWGWDFVEAAAGAAPASGEDWRDADNDPDDFASHGTAVAGLIGGIVNNTIGVTGLVPDVRLMALRVGWSTADAPTGMVSMEYVAQALLYATRMGAAVINCSFATTHEPDLDAAIDDALRAGTIVVTASGNNGTTHAISERGDVVSVAATDAQDVVTRFSNLGSYVAFAAPGYALPTTVLHHVTTDSLGARVPAYSTGATGTSFSCAVASGAAALVQADRARHGLPPLAPLEMVLRLAETSDDIRAQNVGVTGYGAGRLNAARALTDPPGTRVLAASDSVVGPMAGFDFAGATPRIAYTTLAGELVVREGQDGSELLRVNLPAPPIPGVAVARFTAGYGMAVMLSDGRIDLVGENGAPLSGWPLAAGTTGAGGSLALGDVDGDGRADIVLGGPDGTLHAWNEFGELLAGFPRFVGARRYPAQLHVALDDIDGIGGAEIVAVSPDGTVDVVGAGGASMPGWPRFALGGAGEPVVFSGPADSVQIATVAGSDLYVFDATGNRRQAQLEAPATGNLSAADLDGDGRDELIVTYAAAPRAQAVDRAGVPKATFDWSLLAHTQAPGEALAGALRSATSDVALFVPAVGMLAFDAHGTMLQNSPRVGGAGASAAFGDYDKDGTMELLAAGGWRRAFLAYGGARHVGALPTHGWSGPRGNAARTGSVRYDPARHETPSDTSHVLRVSRSQVSFGDVWLGTRADALLHLTNGTPDSVTVELDAPAPFTVAPASLVLPPGVVAPFSVSFTPTTRGPAGSAVHIHVDSGGTLTIALDGNGILPPTLAVDVDTLRVSTSVGDSTYATVELVNQGDAVLDVRPAIERLSPLTAASPARLAAASTAVVASSVAASWLDTLLRQLGYDVLHANPETLSRDTLALGDLVVLALDGGLVGPDVVHALADAVRGGTSALVLGGTRYAGFAQAFATDIAQLQGAPAWRRSDPPDFVLRSAVAVYADSLPARRTWTHPEAATYVLRVADPEAQVVATHGNGDPLLVVRRLGLGSVMLWTGTPADSAWKDPGDLALLRQVMSNAARAASEWVRVAADPVLVPPAAAVPLRVSFHGSAQKPGILHATLRLDSNDPRRPIVRIPIEYDVLPPASGRAAR